MKKLVVFFIAISFLTGIKKVEAQVGVGVNISIAPPELPDYSQPPCPTDGYMWSPGYWAYGPNGYYWVPGVWVASPEVGFLWTPGYWGYGNGGYFWNGGYWGTNVGFYGGVCYGYGYGGTGFYGGRWQGSNFQYNTAAWHVNNSVVHNTYVDRTVINNTSSRSSFNGVGGVTRQANTEELAAAKENHVQPTSVQQSHAQSASINRNQLATANGGHPSTTAKSSVGGERFNSGGHSISTIHAPANHAVANNHPVATRPANNASHANTSPQAQRAPTQNRSMQPTNRGVQHQAQPSRGAQGGGGGGRSMGGGGGGGKKH